ncbi:MAG: hypothetical protein Q4B09_07710 [Lachnospiraceae bacterium]|nr:hypothetical protein [Lachnospiraceae bacterium]
MKKETKQEKSIFRKWWFIILAILFVVGGKDQTDMFTKVEPKQEVTESGAAVESEAEESKEEIESAASSAEEPVEDEVK